MLSSRAQKKKTSPSKPRTSTTSLKAATSKERASKPSKSPCETPPVEKKEKKLKEGEEIN